MMKLVETLSGAGGLVVPSLQMNVEIDGIISRMSIRRETSQEAH